MAAEVGDEASALHNATSNAGALEPSAEVEQQHDKSSPEIAPPTVSSKALKLWVPQHRMNFKRAGYGVIQRAVKQLGWQKAKSDFTFAWMDRWNNNDLTIVQNWRRNHFPGVCFSSPLMPMKARGGLSNGQLSIRCKLKEL